MIPAGCDDWSCRTAGSTESRPRFRVLPWVLASLGAAALVAACATGVAVTPSDADTVLRHLALDTDNPAEPGPYAVERLYYGSGTDLRRPEYRDSVAIRTDPVDASKLVSLGSNAKERNGYWGFKPDAFPVNGRVWYPVGDGPFPLVLIVHGNHNMREYSDPGYGYLGELLASRGVITVSVDENFLNGGISGENDARGWMLLKHLEAWRSFRDSTGGPFQGKVDLDRVGLVGHSRGGEAVAVAAAFNRLSHYPDDASVRFDFGFGIRAVIAIAPVDGQYMPTGRHTPLRDVNYLVFHGSHDGDVTSFHGLRQYHRIDWSGEGDFFKAAVYMYRANHGQWNTVWNSHDNGPRSGRILDLGALIDAEDQRTFGKLYISAFLGASLQDRSEYLPIFRDHRTVGRWLPPTIYVTRFQASSFRPLATFEEDIDVTTGTAPGVSLMADTTAKWSERRLDLRSRNRSTTSGSQVNQAAWIGWNRRVADSDSVGLPSVFAVDLPGTLARSWEIGEGWTVDFLVAATEDAPGPRPAPRDTTADDGQQVIGDRTANDDVETRDDDDADNAADPDSADTAPVDFSVVVTDSDGDSARVAVGRYAPIRRPLKISVLRRKDLEDDRFGADHELVLQSVSIPVEDLREANHAFDPSGIVRIAFVFDRTEKGTVIMDDIGFTRLPPAFLSARVPADDVSARPGNGP